MGNSSSSSVPTLNWSAPHPQTAERAQERINTLAAFLFQRFTEYENANFLAMDDAQFERDQFYYQVVLHDVGVLANRFGEANVHAVLRSRLERLRQLHERAVEKVAEARRRRRIFGGAALGGATLAATTAAAPFALAAVGFSANGVVGGSLAAGAQSYYYGAYTTGLFSLCQSVGAVGVGAGTTASLATLGAGVGGALGSRGTAQREGETHPAEAHLGPRFSWESGMTIDELWEAERRARNANRGERDANRGESDEPKKEPDEPKQ